MISRILTVALSTMALAAGCVTPPEPGSEPLTSNVVDWRDEVIYQIMTDRFADGDESNDYNKNLYDPSAYHGGDWQGIIDKLDYLEALGVTALWISPVVKNVESDSGFASYHGYWTEDFERTNPHFGDLIGLRELSDAAHARGFKMILDVVLNHVGQAFYYDINMNGQPDEFFIGQGGKIVPINQAGDTSDLTRILEWDPDFSATGIQAWTSLGPSGLAPIVFARDPTINRMPPQPDIFSHDYAYNRKGRVTVWTRPEVCGCAPWGCAWNNPCRRQQEIEGDFPGGLKDIATTRPDVRDALYHAFARWIDIGDFDGFRIDTLKHIEPDFFEDFCPRIRQHAAERGKTNFFMFGEAFDGDDNLLGEYTQGEGVDSVFYFSQYYTLFRGALLGDGGRTCELARLHCRREGCDEDPCQEGETFGALYSGTGKTGGPTSADGEPLTSRQLVVNFIENHDVGRLLFFMPQTWSQAEKRKVLHLALVYLMTAEGIPSLYYGVEQEFSGGNDPANRETLWDPAAYRTSVLSGGRWQDTQRTYDADGDGKDDTVWQPYDTGNPTFRFLANLIALRKAHPALRRGDFTVRWSTRDDALEDAGIFAFERDHAEETAVVVMNLSPDQTATTAHAGVTMAVGLTPGTEVTDLLSPTESWTVTGAGCDGAPGEGCLQVDVPPHTARILSTR